MGQPFSRCLQIAVAAIVALLMQQSAGFAAPPNVMIILSDDQAWTDYGFMGHPSIQTPHLDKLASESAVFTRGYVPTSLCRPSLATLITGLYPHQHKIVGNDPPRGTNRAALLKHIANVDTVPKLLGEAGYASLQTGKWWEGNHKTGGFTNGMTHGDPTRGGRHGDVGLKIGREGLGEIATFLDERGDKPFFLWYAPILPHTPHNPPAKYLEKYQIEGRSPHVARYYAMCEWFDATCGELLTMLDKRGLSENTLVVYVTDNGWIQDEHAPRYAPKSKLSHYDGGLRTPILLRWPKQISPKKFDTLVSSIDIAPTILQACGVKAVEQMPGVSLLDVCEGKELKRDAVFGEVFTHDFASVDEPAKSLRSRWCVCGEWKLIIPQDRAASGEKLPVELYNVADDPHETKNLAADNKVKVEELTERINAWWPAK